MTSRSKPSRTSRWLPVDFYAGGPEHVARHHLYARFITMALHDLGLLRIVEPFPRVRLHGFITRNGAKLSKSKGNVIRPEEYIERHGSDVLRLHLLFCCRWEEGGDWRDEAIAGVERFAAKAWRAVAACGAGAEGAEAADPAVGRAAERIAKAIDDMRFNVGVAALMELLTELGEEPSRTSLRGFVLLLAPFAPYLAEELWSMLAGDGPSVHVQPWPQSGGSRCEEVGLSVQIDGRHRGVLRVASDSSEETIESAVFADPRLVERLGGRRVTKITHVPGRAVVLVTVPAQGSTTQSQEEK